MPKVKMLYGEIPSKIFVNKEAVEFDADGIADVSEEAAAVFAEQPHAYEVSEASEEEAKARAQAKEDAEAKAQAAYEDDMLKAAEEAAKVTSEPQPASEDEEDDADAADAAEIAAIEAATAPDAHIAPVAPSRPRRTAPRNG